MLDSRPVGPVCADKHGLLLAGGSAQVKPSKRVRRINVSARRPAVGAEEDDAQLDWVNLADDMR